MKLAQLKALIKKGESDTLEFKTSTASLSSAMQTICAFLNSSGGKVIFGIKDNGQIVGQEVTDKTKKDIAVELRKIDPPAKIDVQYLSVTESREVIVVSVDVNDNAPYTYDGRPFMRNQSTTTKMIKEDYFYLHNQNHPPLWENLVSNNCKITDLDRERIREVVRMAVAKQRMPESALSATLPDILKKLDLIVNDRLTNAAVVLFCKNERKQFQQSNLKLARFKGLDKSEFFDTKYVCANAFDLYDKAMDFLSFALPVAARIESNNPVRVEEPAIPYKVLREGITNALVHRDYNHAGGSVAIALYDDRVNISNTGALPKGVILSQLSKEHPSIPRNPRIAHVFYLCGRIEKWGRGTVDMIDDCRKSGNPAPQFEEIGGSFSLTLPLKIPIRTIIYE